MIESTDRKTGFWPRLASFSREVDSVLERDPAATSRLEVLLTYSGFHAVQIHRVAHWLYQRDYRLAARAVSQFNRWLTQVEIHPAAKIGARLFIDHGSGVVIGETAEVGDDVTILQGVTLGGTGKQSGKRHPTIGDRVSIGTGAKLLGGFSVGANSRIGANAVVLREVPPNSTVVGVPGRVVVQDGKRTTNQPSDLNWIDMPDPEQQDVEQLLHRIQDLESRLIRLESSLNGAGGRTEAEEAVVGNPAEAHADRAV
ncbi:MAG: serine O-acetyltransferase [Chloroflexota bacterium]|nr:serine O-acetyltransferase [Chloroflexota bacterium]